MTTAETIVNISGVKIREHIFKTIQYVSGAGIKNFNAISLVFNKTWTNKRALVFYEENMIGFVDIWIDEENGELKIKYTDIKY